MPIREARLTGFRIAYRDITTAILDSLIPPDSDNQ